MEMKLKRDRINITIPIWLRKEATEIGAMRGFGMSELITRLLERYVETEKARLGLGVLPDPGQMEAEAATAAASAASTPQPPKKRSKRGQPK